MSDVQHTPGPWKVEVKPAEFVIRSREGIRVISTSWHHSTRNPYPLEKEAEANAHLIAAAPDLLAALEIILMTHDLSCKGEDCQISGIDLARVAIAKARGQS